MNEQRTSGSSEKEEQGITGEGRGGEGAALASRDGAASEGRSNGERASGSSLRRIALTGAGIGFAAPWAGGLLLYGAFIAFLAVAFADLGVISVLVMGLILAALPTGIVAVWLLGRAALRAVGARTPEAAASLVTGCVVLSAVLFHTGGSLVFDHWPAVAAAAGLASAAGCGLAALFPRPVPLIVAAAVVLGGTAAAALGLPPELEAREERAERRAIMGDTDAAFAVVDHPEWRRTGISGQHGRLTVHYEHADGDRVSVETWNREFDEAVDYQCDYRQMQCEWKGDLLVVREEGEIDEVRTVLPDGPVVSVLATSVTARVDLMEPARHVRTGTPAEREEIINGPEV
ncbi:hypothetical protein [Nocardiopsis baichengensis]|uniref:hypothetical protein n=1 Tax=Nocardiopsis baichengensis TaxID=280240 RepID=UPI00034CF6DB|nr:hypothetical protein [Nocardiopsis baichengensis]